MIRPLKSFCRANSVKLFGILFLLAGSLLAISCRKEIESDTEEEACIEEASFTAVWRQPRDTDFFVGPNRPFLHGDYLVYRTWRGFTNKFVVRNLSDGSLHKEYVISNTSLATSDFVAKDGLVYFNEKEYLGISDPVSQSTHYIYYPESVSSGFLMNGDKIYLTGWSKDTAQSIEYLLSFDIPNEKLDTIRTFHFDKAPNRGVLLSLVYFYENDQGIKVVLRQESPAGYYLNFITFLAVGIGSGNIEAKVETGEMQPSETIGNSKNFTIYEWSKSFENYNMDRGGKQWEYQPPVLQEWSGIIGQTDDKVIIDYYPGAAALDKNTGALAWKYMENLEVPRNPRTYDNSLLLTSENRLLKLDQEKGCLKGQMSFYTDNGEPDLIEHVEYFEDKNLLIVITGSEVVALQKS